MCNLWTRIHGVKQSIAPFALRIGNEVKSRSTHSWPNHPLELTAYSAGFVGYSWCFLLWAAAQWQRSAADFWGTNLPDEELFMPLFYESASIERYKVFRDRTLFTHRALCDRASSGVANS